MTFIPTPNCSRAVVNYIRGTSTFSNVLHFTKQEFVQQDMQNLADEIDEFIGTTWLFKLATDVSYVSTVVYDIRTIDGLVVTSAGSAGPGSIAGGAVPVNCALVVTLRTAARGRTGRGRVFITGWPDGTLSNDNFDVASGADALTYVSGIRSAAQAVGWTHVIRSIQANGVTLNPAVTREVTQAVVRSRIVGSQRKRIDRG